ncbi:MAG: serine hydrolase domain-containing protein [Burkholderiales bacterium]
MKPRKALFLALLAYSAFVAAAPPYQRPAGAAEDKEPLIVAGYRALFTCSAHFIAQRPLDDIKRVELIDVASLGYPDPVIDEARKLVSSNDISGDIVRVAAFRDTMGCTLLPPHWELSDLSRLPYVAHEALPDVRAIPFPAGDKVDLPANGIGSEHRELAPILERAFDGKSYGDGVMTTALMIVKGGKIIAERYRPGFGIHSGYRTWSTTKSITAALMSIASMKGILDFNGRAEIPEWSDRADPRRAITYKHLLWMSSGLASGGANTNAIYFGGQDVVSAVTTTELEAQPGTRWKYANNDTLLLLRSLRHRLSDDRKYLRFPYDELLHPLGMYHTIMEVDHLGNFIGSSQTYTTARDLARFALLLANDGVWNGKRLLPEGWVKFATTPAPSKPPVPGQWGYGAQFWLLDQMPGVPPGTFTTAGNKGQYATVVPGQDLVIVRTGVDPGGKRWEQHRLVADVAAALAK